MNNLKKSLNNKTAILFVAGVILCAVAFAVGICFGSSELSLAQLLQSSRDILFYVRLPRTVACMLSGAALSVSGAILQGVLSNKLASPGIIGVNAGAGLGVTVCLAMGLLSGWAVSLSAFLGSLAAVLIISAAAYGMGASRSTVILGGVAINSILNAISESITVVNPEISVMSMEFRMGGFSSVAYSRLAPAGILIILALVTAFTLCNELDVLTLGDETAQGLGMSVKTSKTLFLILAALLSGASVSLSGLLGFVGLVVPHFVRRVASRCGAKMGSAVLIPLCVLYGAAFVTICDVVARMIFAPFEIPVGIIMAIFGGPFFIVLLIQSKGGHSHD